MAMNMKEVIAEAVRTLLMDKKVKKLTVKDIVEECHITRQTFYYHFEDIPHLFLWILQQGAERMKIEAKKQGGEEGALKCFFLLAINTRPYIKSTMESNYGEELARLLQQQADQMFDEIVEHEGLYRSADPAQLKLLMRYHCHGIMGIIRDWTEEDTQNLDQIVHTVYQILTGSVSLRAEYRS